MSDSTHEGEFPISKCPLVHEPFRVPQRIDRIESKLDIGAEHHRKLDADVERMLGILTNGLTTKASVMEIEVAALRSDVAYLRGDKFAAAITAQITKQVSDQLAKKMFRLAVAVCVALVGVATAAVNAADKFGII